jgi:glycosyltransferase involved in cell wall biosynthesis
MTAPVDVLLATYNGAQFLGEQLRSIEAQSYGNWRLIARDDGSTDETPGILDRFRQRHPDRVTLIEDGPRRLGASQNFHRLLQCSRSELLFFCDQDDIWANNKIARFVELYETRSGRELPVLLHSDLSLVDADLRPIAASLWQYQHLRPENATFSRLLVQNVVTGCAAAVNRLLVQAALPVSEAAIMHDWWFALVASVLGRIVWTPEQLVRYRQHGRNDVGAKPWSLLSRIRKMGTFRHDWSQFGKTIAAAQKQADALASHSALQHFPAERQMAQQFARLKSLPYLRRLTFLANHGILKTGIVRNASMFVRI